MAIFWRSRSVLASSSAGWVRLQPLPDRVHALHLLPQGGDLLAQPLGLGFDLRRLGAVRGLQCRQVALDALLDLLLTLVDLARREVAIAAVDRLELAAVDRHDRLREQLQIAAQLHEAAAGVANANTVVVTEVGNGLEIGRQAPGQPHRLDIAPGLAFQPPARRNAVQITVEANLQQHRRVVGRAARRCRLSAGKAQLREIELCHEGVARTHRIVVSDVVVEILRQQRALITAFTLNKALHPTPPPALCAKVGDQRVFTQPRPGAEIQAADERCESSYRS